MNPILATFLLSVAIAVLATTMPRLRAFAFGLWVVVAFTAALQFPEAFLNWGTLNLAVLIVPLLQIIMFGMGTTLTVSDFRRALAQPKPVLIGIATQFLVMPLVGFGLASTMRLEPDAMVGVILVGSVSGGVASNLMVFLARGNVALSVTMTACSTLLSPFVTPLLMKIFAGTMVPISFVAMMLSIFNMIIVPVIAGLVAHEILYSRKRWADRGAAHLGILFLSLVLWQLLSLADEWDFGWAGSIRPGLLVGIGMIALVALFKLISLGCKGSQRDWVATLLPVVSMAGIWIIIAIITARSRETLLTVGGALIVVAILHNGIGYLLGYWTGRALRLDETTCRTIAFEVGMQNGGMAAGLAMDFLKSPSAALAPAIFSPWMNLSGSLLASWWNRHPAADDRSFSTPTTT